MTDGVSPQFHGGDLAVARRARPQIEEWIDLSTGINPWGYPPVMVDTEIWRRLPDAALANRCISAARDYYQVPQASGCVQGAGSQQLIQLLPQLLPASSVAIVGPTYNEHLAAWATGPAKVRQIGAAELDCADDVLVLVNPNNPDGRLLARSALLQLVHQRTAMGRWTVVDEAFMDLTPDTSLVPESAGLQVVILRSLGKFFGLAGARVGHCVMPADLAARAQALLGPWPVAGPSLAIAEAAFLDRRWQQQMRHHLASQARQLAGILTHPAIDGVGGTDLFKLVSCPRAPALFEHLLDHGIYVRRFSTQPHQLRVGLPADDDEFARLHTAIEAFA